MMIQVKTYPHELTNSYEVQWCYKNVVPVDDNMVIIQVNICYISGKTVYSTPVSVLFGKDKYNAISYLAALGIHSAISDFSDAVKPGGMYTNVVAYITGLVLDKLHLGYTTVGLNRDTRLFCAFDTNENRVIWRLANDLYNYGVSLLHHTGIKPIDYVLIDDDAKSLYAYDIDGESLSTKAPYEHPYAYGLMPPYYIVNKHSSRHKDTGVLVDSLS